MSLNAELAQATVMLEQRMMRHLGNGLAFELALVALMNTHASQELYEEVKRLRASYLELMEGSVLMVDDVSAQAGEAFKQFNKMMDRLEKAAHP